MNLRRMGVWAYGRMGVWAYGRMGVWAYGRMGVWAYGRMGVSACRRVGVPRPKAVANRIVSCARVPSDIELPSGRLDQSF
jgi:hypothetical protein